MTQPLENRISALEARLEFQDETIAALNEALVVQQQRYFELDRAFKLLTRRLREQNIAESSYVTLDAKDEPPPPHY